MARDDRIVTRLELACACALDAIVGDPAALPHPVQVMGAVIAAVDRRYARAAPERDLIAGAALALGLTAASSAVAAAFARRKLARIVAAASTLAGRSLITAILDVERALRAGDIGAARAAVARVVGRDVAGLGESEIARAAIETLAESFCDGMVAPLMALRLGGSAGAFAFKAISTLDSMIGHREAPYTWFGRVAARLDDGCNWLPARIAALAIVAAASISGDDGAGAFATARTDAARHASPNAGWPEAAIAGALHIRLGGTNRYAGVPTDGAILNAGGDVPTRSHLVRAIRIVAIATILVELATIASASR